MASTAPVRVAIDIETTGLQVETESIIEIGAIKFRGDETLETFETMIAPVRPLPYRIQRLTSITPAMLSGAPQFAAIAPRLRGFLGDLPLVGHSVGFDAGFLRKMHVAERNALLDTFDLASLLLPTLSSYSLENVAASLGLSAPVHHRALADAVLARDVLLALEERIAALPDPILNDLCALSLPATVPAIVLLRQEQRARGNMPVGATTASFGGALGAALNAKMRVDPAVLGTRVASLGAAAPTTVPLALAPAMTTAADDAAHQVIAATFAAKETAIIEIDPEPERVAAVLVPALAWAMRQRRRIVIAAASMASARELAQVHVPRALAALTGEDAAALTIAPLFESHEYLCPHRWYGPGREVVAATADGLRGLAKLSLWMHTTATGARDEVSLNPKEAIAWEAVRAGAQFVALPDCAYRERGWCFARRAREAAGLAQVVVTTHAALLAHEVASGDNKVPATRYVPPADGYLILEGQMLEERAIAQATTNFEYASLLDGLSSLWQRAEREPVGLLARALVALPGSSNQGWGNQITRAHEALRAFFDALATFLTDAQATGQAMNEGQPAALRLDDDARNQEAWGALADTWQSAEKRLAAAAEAVTQAARALAQTRGAESLALELTARGQWLRQTARWGHEAILQPHTDTVYWLRSPQTFTRFGPRGRGNTAPSNAATGQADFPSMHSAPAQVAQNISAALQAIDAGIVIAGTPLTVDGRFDYTSERLGLPHGAQTAIVSTDRAAQTLLLMPSDAPEPNAPTYQRALNEALTQVALALQGQTVALFSSYTAMRGTYSAIKPILEQHDIMVLAQGIDGSQRQLWNNYRAQERVVLLGAGSFWDGWESEGAQPQCLFIPRLPLAALSDPLLASRAEGYADPMQQFLVPHAALRLRHALNRLAWEHHERNVVVLYDRRVHTKAYGATIVNTLPALTQREESVTRLGEIAHDWLDK